MLLLLLFFTFLIGMHSFSIGLSDRPLKLSRGRKRKAEDDLEMKVAKRLAAETVGFLHH
jgi:hypothetical protein